MLSWSDGLGDAAGGRSRLTRAYTKAAHSGCGRPEPAIANRRALGPLLSFSLPQAVDEDGGDNDEADDDFLERGGPAHLLRAVAQDSHDECADHRAEHGADTAGEARATNN